MVDQPIWSDQIKELMTRSLYRGRNASVFILLWAMFVHLRATVCAITREHVKACAGAPGKAPKRKRNALGDPRNKLYNQCTQAPWYVHNGNAGHGQSVALARASAHKSRISATFHGFALTHTVVRHVLGLWVLLVDPRAREQQRTPRTG
jgi:hypothetical protein